MSPGDDERRPRQESGVNVEHDNAIRIQAQELPALDQCGPTVRALIFAWYEAGCRIGWQDGYNAAEADMQAVWSAVARRVQALGSPSSVPYSVLAERRGQHERAARARENERRVMCG